MSSLGVLNSSYREHVMLLYHTDEERNAAAVDYINEGLKKDHFCIYASVGAYDDTSKWHYSNLSSQIENFEQNIKQGNLMIIDFRPLFEATRRGDPTLFNQLKSRIETMLKQRVAEGRGDKVLLFADAACTLSENKEFEKCVELESWWHYAHQEWIESNQNITIICPHPATVFNKDGTTAHAKAQIAAVHSIMLRARNDKHHTAAVAEPIRVLIAEPEQDIQTIYRLYSDSLGIQTTIVSNANRCLESVFNTAESKGFDLIILDTHLKDISGIEVARKIKQRLPDQQIIITSTTTSVDEMERFGISKDNILQKPFGFSKLLGLIKPKK
jgi:CheY-like chemotaxis protein